MATLDAAGNPRRRGRRTYRKIDRVVCGVPLMKPGRVCGLTKGHSAKQPHLSIEAVAHMRAATRANLAAKRALRTADQIEADKAERLRVSRERYAYLNDIKLTRGCADCGYNGHPAALDFDHLPGTVKTGDVSRLIMCSLTRLDAEIAKCEVVCSNCHRIRTWERAAVTERMAG